MALSRRRWREVGFADMADGEHRALVLVSHEGIDRREALDVLCHRWPDVVLKNLEHEVPTVAM